jgi:hypothetical protein
MKNLTLLLSLTLLGCGTTSVPVNSTGNPNEYVVYAKNFMSVFSSLEEAQRETVTQAMNYCSNLGKTYTKKYSLDKPMALGQVPESTLYFTCTDSSNKTPTISFNEAKSKCLDLGFKKDTESFGQCVLKLTQ